MILNTETTKLAEALTLLGAKTDAIFFDDELPGYGYRLRRNPKGKVQRTYVAQYRTGGSTRRVLLGSADVLTAVQAREAAKRVLARATLGQDPQGEKAALRDREKLKLKVLMDEYLGEMRTQVRRKTGSTRRPKTLTEMSRYLTGSYFRPLHLMPVDSVKHSDVASCLRSIRRNSSETTMALARSKLHSFFVWAMREGYAVANPVAATHQPQPAPERDRVLSDDELVAVWNGCDDPGLGEFGKIIRLNILIPARRSEIGGIARNELDFDNTQWTLPKERSKNHRAVTYPLMPMALEIIRSVPRRMGRDQLFGERRAEGFSSWVKYKASLDAKLSNTVMRWLIHDVRRSVATKMADIGIEPHIIEVLLNHHSGHKSGPAGIYNKSSYERQVRAALALWEDHIRSLVASGKRKVLSFAPAEAS